MDDIVTVLAEEHGCLDTIKVELKAPASSLTFKPLDVIDVISLGSLYLMCGSGFVFSH